MESQVLIDSLLTIYRFVMSPEVSAINKAELLEMLQGETGLVRLRKYIVSSTTSTVRNDVIKQRIIRKLSLMVLL
jgi:hypothetical protein